MQRSQPPTPVKPQESPAQTLSFSERSNYTDRGVYLLGPNDVLELRVLGEPQLDGLFDVEDDGTIRLPFIDEPVQASCREVNDLRKEVVKSLGKFLKQPRVFLRVKESPPPSTARCARR
jgi:protein involved in polysaccharide export with SLBB domain